MRVRALQADEWDAVWAEYDARQAVPPPMPVVAAPARSRFWRLLGLGGMAAFAAYLALPVAAAVSVAGAVQRLDVPSLTQQVDWPALRGGMKEVLVQEAERHGAMPPFIHAMAEDMAGRLASPQGLATALNERVGGAAASGQLVRDLVPEALNRWRVTLGAASGDARQAASLTLAMSGPLRWSVTGLDVAPR